MEQSRRDLTSTDLKVVTIDKQDTLGAIGSTQDERLYRYCSIGGAQVVAGLVLSSPTVTTGYLGLSVQSAVTAGVNSLTIPVTLGSTSAAADQFIDGSITVISGTGSGQTYRIRGNQLGSVNKTMQVYLYENVSASLDTTSVVHIIPNLWANLTAQTLSGSGGDNPKCVGVTLGTMAANTYGWIQSEGVGTLTVDNVNNSGAGAGVVYQGLNLVLSTGTAGYVSLANPNSDADKQTLGYSLVAHGNVSSNKAFPAYITIY